MHFVKSVFVCSVLILQSGYVFADPATKTDWDNFKFKTEMCPDGANGNGDRSPRSYTLGSIQGSKIEVLDQTEDDSGQWKDEIVFGVSRPKKNQKVCQSVSVTTIAEAGKPELKIESDSLVIRQTVYSRYSPESWETTTTYHLDNDGKFEILSNKVVNPFDEFKKRFESALRGSDLSTLLALRDEYVAKLAGGYNAGFFNQERRSLCFRSLEVATKLANKDVDASKAVFTRFFAKPSDDMARQYPCAETYDPPANLIMPLHREREESATDEGTEAIQQLTEECDSSMWEDCTPLSPNDILILNNAAFLLQKMGQHTEAIKLLRNVLKQDPQRRVAYKNLGDSLAAQKKSGSSLALLAPTVIKRNGKSLSRADVLAVAKQTGATCERSETLTSLISGRRNAIEFEFRCQLAGANVNEGRLRARWDYTLDEVVIIKTLAEKKASMYCPVSSVDKQKQLRSWAATNSYPGRLPGGASKVGEPCEDVAGYQQFGDCKWLIACRGGLKRSEVTERGFWGTIIDFIVIDEYDESIHKISRSSGSRTRLTPIEKGVEIEESVRIAPDKTHRESQIVKTGAFTLTCDGETCGESVYHCEVSDSLKSLAIELRPINVDRGSAPVFEKYDTKLTTFFSTKNEAPSFEVGQLMSRRGYFDQGFSEELWDVGLMRKRRLSCDRK